MRIKKLIPFLLLFLVIDAVFLYKPLFTGCVPVPGDDLKAMQPWRSGPYSREGWNVLQADGILQFYNWRSFYVGCVKKGELPLYNPYEFSGTEFVGTGQSAVYYPFNLLLPVFGVNRGLGILALIHLFIAQVFTFLLVRMYKTKNVFAAVAALGFSLSGFMVCWLELPTLVYSAAWLPAALYFTLKAFRLRNIYFAAAAGLALGLSVLAGHLQIAVFVIGCSLFYLLWLTVSYFRQSRQFALLAAAVFAAVFLFTAAFQLIPSADLYSRSARNTARCAEGYKTYISNAFPAGRLITLFVPAAYAHLPVSNKADEIEYAAYFGLLPLLFSFCGVVSTVRKRAKERYVLLALYVLILLVLCGSPLNYILYWFVPGFNSMGGPNRLLFAALLFASVFSAFGLEDMTRDKKNAKKLLCAGWAFLAVLFAASVVAAAGYSHGYISQLLLLEGAAPFFVLLFLVLFCCLMMADVKQKSAVYITALLFVACDLLVFALPQPSYTKAAFLKDEPELVKYLRQLDYERVAFINDKWSLFFAPDALMPPDMSMLYGIREAGGYDSLYSDAYRKKLTDILDTDPSPQENGNMMFVKKYTPALGSLCDIVVSAEPLRHDTLKLQKQIGACYVYRIKNAAVPHCVFLNNYTVQIEKGKRNGVWLAGRWKKARANASGSEVWVYSPPLFKPAAFVPIGIIILLFVVCLQKIICKKVAQND